MPGRSGRKLWFTYLTLLGLLMLLAGLGSLEGDETGAAVLLFGVGGMSLLTMALEWRHTRLGRWLGALHWIPLLALVIGAASQDHADEVLTASTLLVLYLVYRLPKYVSTEYYHQLKRAIVRFRHRVLQAYLAGLLPIGGVFVPWRRVAVLPDTQDVPLETSYHPLYDPPDEGDLQATRDIGRFYRTELVTDRYASAVLL